MLKAGCASLSRPTGYGGNRMDPKIITELKIPDLWYDFYARFLPGTLFVASLYILWPGDASIPSGWMGAIIAFGGYIAGLLLQPLSSELTGLLHDLMAHLVTGDKYYVRKQKHLDPRRILSKMHGETTFFVQCFIMSSVLIILQMISSLNLESSTGTIIANIFFIVYVLLMAVDMAWRRVRRAKLLTNDQVP
jgi:hypothetical protein